MLTKLTLLFMVTIVSVNLFSQETRPISINMSYFGETITHPGLKLGIEYPVKLITTKKTKKSGKEIEKHKSLFVATNLAFYYQKRYNTGVLLNAEFGYRKHSKKGFKIEYLVGFGGIRTFLNSETFEVTENGLVEPIKFAGQFGLLPSIAIGFGKSFGQNTSKKWAYHIKPSFYFQIAKSQAVIPHFILETGIVYQLNH